MASEEREKIFLRVRPLLKTAWKRMCESRKIDQNLAGEAMVEWITGQPPEVQQMVLGSLPASPDLVLIVMRRLLTEAAKAGGPKMDVLLADANGNTIHEWPARSPGPGQKPAREPTRSRR